MRTFEPGVIGRVLLVLSVVLSACGGGSGSSPANTPPVAVAGAAQTVPQGALVTLDGSRSSDADGNSLAFAWTLSSAPQGSAAVLTGATTASPTFTPDVAGTYLATLVVNDGQGGSNSASVTITAEGPKLMLIQAPASGCTQDCVDSTVPLPYNNLEVFAPTCGADTCPDTLEVRVFRLAAARGNFTVSGLAAENLTPGARRDSGPLSVSVPAVVPAFDGLLDGQVIRAGETVTFRLVATRTFGSTATLRFSFKVLETNEEFLYSVLMTSN